MDMSVPNCGSAVIGKREDVCISGICEGCKEMVGESDGDWRGKGQE